MKNIKQKIVKILLITFGIIFLLLVALYFFRDAILKQILTKAEIKFSQEYNCKFTVGEAKFVDLAEVSIKDLNLVPLSADTLVHIGKMEIKVNISQLFAGNIQLEKLNLENTFVQLVKNEKGKNFDNFFKPKPKNEETDTLAKRDYADYAYNLITQFLNLIPEKSKIQNFEFRFDDLGKKVLLKTNNLSLKDNQINTIFDITTSTFNQKWTINGLVNPREKIADLYIKNTDSTQIRLPYIDQKFKLPTSFDNLHLKIDNIDTDFGDLHIDGSSSVENFTVNNSKISKKDVVFTKAVFNFKLLIGSNFIKVTDESEVILNNIKCNPYLEYNTEKDKVYTLKANIPKMKAQDFINSLPAGLFSHFQGMKANGDFTFNLNFKLNINKPWNLVFNTNLNKYGLNISQYGDANLAKLNSDFEYRAMENGKQQRPVFVGLQNPFYTPLDQISPFLQKSVLTCEDPSFMSHKGFVNEAFKQSIIKNIRTKKFSRGASTISMQLVKNVFLTREKTLSRKLEEILLVYILENNRIVSKERMLEVYFNVIEWGPNVYGIGEASAFYFKKKPIDLTLKECLFLASIVPKPKKFMFQFDDAGNQKTNADKKQMYISKLMFRRGLLSPEDTIGQKAPVFISGFARSLLRLKPTDTIQQDSTQIIEPIFE